MSELTRKNVWDWYTGTIYNRLKPGGAVVIINHRMHEDDLSGRLLAQQAAGGDRWEVVRAACHQRRQRGTVARCVSDRGAGAHQANTQATGLVSALPAGPDPGRWRLLPERMAAALRHAAALATMVIYGGSDYAVTRRRRLHRAYRGRRRSGGPHVPARPLAQAGGIGRMGRGVLRLVKHWKPQDGPRRPGRSRPAWGRSSRRCSASGRPIVYREQFPTRGDKAVRAQAIRGRMAMDGLYVPEHATWYPAFRSELLNFPYGKHDDCVDAIGLIGQLLDLHEQRPAAQVR